MRQHIHTEQDVESIGLVNFESDSFCKYYGQTGRRFIVAYQPESKYESF